MARNLVRFNPFLDLDTFERQFFENSPLSPWRGLRMPATDVYTEDDEKLVAKVHLPGFSESDVSVDLDQNALVIQADKHEKEEDSKKKYVVRETRDSYYRRISLPEQADAAKVDARFDKGVLTVTVPFKELPGTTRIAINSGND